MSVVGGLPGEDILMYFQDETQRVVTIKYVHGRNKRAGHGVAKTL